jgi:hypothetical protein
MGRDKEVVATFVGPSLTVAAPNGGEVWETGTLKRIKWAYTGRPGSYVRIELLEGGVWVRTITGTAGRGTGGKGHYDWLVPREFPAGNDYRIRVTSTRNSDYTDSASALWHPSMKRVFASALSRIWSLRENRMRICHFRSVHFP